MTLNVRAFAITCGLIWGLGLFLVTWWIIIIDGSSDQYTFLARVYRGYSMTPTGSIIGAAWGLLDGLVGGAVFAWLYNRIVSSRA